MTNKILLSVFVIIYSGIMFAGDKHDHKFPKTIAAFHDVMAPLWHGKPGEDRQKATCNKIPDMITKAKAIESADNKTLVESLEILQTVCKKPVTEFDAEFAKLHATFHKVAKVKEDPTHKHQ